MSAFALPTRPSCTGVLQTAHVILEAELSDWKTGNCKQLKLFVENESEMKRSIWLSYSSPEPEF